MISIKKYLDGVESEEGQGAAESEDPVLSAALDAYRSTLREMGNSGAAVCPVLGADFQQSLERLEKASPATSMQSQQRNPACASCCRIGADARCTITSREPER